MSDVKWIKISTGVFNDECFEIIDDMPEADAIELIWFKLLVLAGKLNEHGLFLFKSEMVYTDEMLSSIFHRPLNIVKLAMKTFLELKMIEQIDGVYTIPNWEKYQNLDAYENKKLRDKEYSKKYREKQKMLLEEKKSSDESSDDSRFCSNSISISNSKSLDTIKDVENNKDTINYKGIIDIYNNTCISLPKVTKITDKRKQKIKARLKNFDTNDFQNAFLKAEESDFLSGRKGNWGASFDWFFENDENMTKVLEGNYDNKKGGTQINNSESLAKKNSNILDNIIATGEINHEFNRDGENN